jgi:predicted Zn-dependent protease with MMP-like domain
MGREIGKGTFPGCLWDIYKKGYAGGLRVERGSLWREVYFENGLPVGSMSNIIQECLGRFLVRLGRLAPEKCEDSLIIMNGLRVRQGEALVKMGLIKEEELPELLRLQLRVRLLGLFGWVDGMYRLREEVAGYLEQLTEYERAVVEHRFGFNGEDGMTLAEIGRLFGLTRERIRQIEARVMEKMERMVKTKWVGFQDVYEGGYGEKEDNGRDKEEIRGEISIEINSCDMEQCFQS